jgi:purine-binding chemotaxis protein CheW
MSPNDLKRDGAIDWQAVHRRLEQARHSMEEAIRPSPKRVREIMKARARALAQEPAEERRADDGIGLVVFKLAGECYAVETHYVREVARFVDFMPVPETPEFLVGITNLHGSMLAVFDLGRFFELSRKGLTDLSRVVVLGTEEPEFGILADETLGQVNADPATILKPTEKALGIDGAYLRGVTHDALIVLDGPTLLGDERFLL